MLQKEFSIFVLRHLSVYNNQRVLKNVYLCLFKSHISYSISLWRATDVILNKMFVCQKKIRALLKLPHQTHCTEHVQRLEIHMVPSLYFLSSCYIKINHLEHTNQNHNHNTRYKHLFSERDDLKLVESKPKYSSLQKLPISFRNIESVNK